jgi:hypothetical protein
MAFYGFEFKNLDKRYDEYAQRIGMYYRFNHKQDRIDWAQRSPRRILVPSSDKELKMLKFRGIIESFCIDDYYTKR